jgi:hypothetical protein
MGFVDIYGGGFHKITRVRVRMGKWLSVIHKWQTKPENGGALTLSFSLLKTFLVVSLFSKTSDLCLSALRAGRAGMTPL